MPSETATTVQPFVISRVFNAPRIEVWKALTLPERLEKWWGPKGFAIIAQKMDFRPGGSYLYGLRMPDGGAMWGRFIYREIEEPSRIVVVTSFSDEDGGVSRHPMSPTWPLHMLSTFRLDEEGQDRTRLTVSWLPIEPSEKELATFAGARESMQQGWKGTLDQLEGFLAGL